jgi:hypothetical protein
MFNYNTKTAIQNILLFAVDVVFFSANVSDLTRISLLKIKNFELSYFHKKLGYANTFK